MPKEREDVEATLEQGTTPDASQQKRKWRSIDRIAGTTLAAEVLMSFIWAILWVHECRFEHQLQVYFASVLIILTGGYLTLIFCPIFKKDDDPRWFHARILSSGIVGGSYAFLLPVVMSLPEGNVNSGGAAALRQAILLATGGLIALIALGETRRKNDNDREAAENLRIHQEKILYQQKEQFEKQIEKQQEQFEANAFKDRKAERRERYTKAVEQLGDEKAPVRMGGVYTLVGLVDEWLEEESIRKYEDRLKEGQVIINNLCAYIRSPFTLATRYDELEDKDSPTSDGVYKDNQQEFYKDKAEFKAEADVRLGIIKEIHDRLQGPDANTPGIWSDFEYDFSGSTFFYSIDLRNSFYTKSVTFHGSTCQDWADFRGSTYQEEAHFYGSTYQKGANFRNSTYGGEADFRNSTYQDWADFSDSTYQWAHFRSSIYLGRANFSDSTYQEEADFCSSTYQDWADFSGSTYHWANFSGSTYQWANFSGSTYRGQAYFSDSTYRGQAYFSDSTYQGQAHFRSSIYQGRADFGDSTYKDVADFSGSIFYQENYFGKDRDSSSFSCFTNCAPIFYKKIFFKENYNQKTLFGSPGNNFAVNADKGYPINLNSEGLPLGCKFLTSKQKEYLEGKLQEIERINDELFEVKDPEEKVELLKKLWSLNEELHERREEATTVNVEDVAAEDTES